jgi:hypothetical protein
MCEISLYDDDPEDEQPSESEENTEKKDQEKYSLYPGVFQAQWLRRSTEEEELEARLNIDLDEYRSIPSTGPLPIINPQESSTAKFSLPRSQDTPDLSPLIQAQVRTPIDPMGAISFSIAPSYRAVALILSKKEHQTHPNLPCPCVLLDERQITEVMVTMRALLMTLREMPVPEVRYGQDGESV